MNKKLDLRVKDNFLNDRDFWYLKDLFLNEQTIYNPVWSISDQDEYKDKDEYDNWFMTHLIYGDCRIYSSSFEEVQKRLITPLKNLEETQFGFLTRIKINMYPHTHEVKEHMLHNILFKYL